MKSSITIFLIAIFLSSCSTNKVEFDNEAYLKILISGEALKPNAYNKGVGAYHYAYFDLSTDSLFYLYPEFKASNEDGESYINHAYQGKMNNSRFRDTIMQLIQSLEWRPSGNIDSIPNGAAYCGWEYYVEFRLKDTVKHYSVILGVSDTLNRFYDFFIRLKRAAWDKQVAKSKVEDIDNEVVSSMKRFGTYESIDIPYLFPACDSGVDFSKLIGRWRSVGANFYSTRKDRFSVYNLYPDGSFLFQQYKEGTFEYRFKGKYWIDAKTRKIFYTTEDGHKMTQTITQLTDSCLSGSERTEEDRISDIKWNRY